MRFQSTLEFLGAVEIFMLPEIAESVFFAYEAQLLPGKT